MPTLKDAATSTPTPYDLPLLKDLPDDLLWNCTSDGEYSAAFAYRILDGIGLEKWEFRDIWNYPLPSLTRIFSFLLLKDKLLTREVMIRRNFNCQTGTCSLCDRGHLESELHLFFQCPYAKALWNRMNTNLGCQIVLEGNSVQETWRNSANQCRSNRNLLSKWQLLFPATLWFIWKQRNSKFFENKLTAPDLVAQWIIEEATL